MSSVTPLTYSVITVCLNSERTISRTIDSVLRQSLRPKKYIFVDGGSKDSTRAIIQSAISSPLARGIHFDVLEQAATGGGITEAWNIGLGRVSEDLVFILNSDDWYDPITASTVVHLFHNDPAWGILVGRGRNYSRSHTVTSGISENRPLFLFPILMPLVHPACFVRKHVYDEQGPFNCAYNVSADYEFLYRCWRAGVTIRQVPDILVNIELGGFSHQNKVIARRETYEVARKHGGRFWPPIAFALRWLSGR